MIYKLYEVVISLSECPGENIVCMNKKRYSSSTVVFLEITRDRKQPKGPSIKEKKK